jgi:hypothetical protein
MKVAAALDVADADRSVGGHVDKTTLYTTLTIGAGLVVLFGEDLWRRRKKRAYATGGWPGTSPASPPAKAVSSKKRPLDKAHRGGVTQTVSRLETELRLAILSPSARERLVQDALRIANGNREAALRRVLDDLHAENNRWS